METCIQNIVNAIIGFSSNPWIRGIAIAIIAAVILFGGRKVHSWLFPIKKIEPLKCAYYIYDYEIRGYIIEVDVWVCFRREIPIVNVDRYFKIEGSNECYSSFDNYEVIDKTSTYHMRFIPEIYNEVEMAASPLSNEKVKGRIIMGKYKSAPFRIVKMLTNRDIVFKREKGKYLPPLASGENEEIT